MKGRCQRIGGTGTTSCAPSSGKPRPVEKPTTRVLFCMRPRSVTLRTDTDDGACRDDQWGPRPIGSMPHALRLRGTTRLNSFTLTNYRTQCQRWPNLSLAPFLSGSPAPPCLLHPHPSQSGRTRVSRWHSIDRRVSSREAERSNNNPVRNYYGLQSRLLCSLHR